MIDAPLMADILESLKDPFVYVDTDHVIRYMNKAAIHHYEEGADLIGRSVFDCHNERSCRLMKDIFAAFQAGEEERLITDNDRHRVYMRAVRDTNGQLRGYYERYEPPSKMTTSQENEESK